jgi:DMSO/TMAO reductase YedYZ molybdopterin-dependent catalytic subunit
MSILSVLKTPVFKAEGIPYMEESSYRLQVKGLVAKEYTFSLNEIKSMPFTSLNARLTSVSGWSVRAEWEGVLLQDFMRHLELMPQALHVVFTSVGGYDTSLPLHEITDRVILAYAVGGEPLEPEYGSPLRLLVPHLWGYKSCKWLARIDFTEQERMGYWESRGYTQSGRIEPGVTLDINTGTKKQIRGGGEIIEF